MKTVRVSLLTIGVLFLAACAQKPPPPGKKVVLQTIQRPNRPPVYLYRDVPDNGSH